MEEKCASLSLVDIISRRVNDSRLVIMFARRNGETIYILPTSLTVAINFPGLVSLPIAFCKVVSNMAACLMLNYLFYRSFVAMLPRCELCSCDIPDFRQEYNNNDNNSTGCSKFNHFSCR